MAEKIRRGVTMATLTDEEKAAAILGDVEDEEKSSPAETTEPANPTPEEEPEVEESAEAKVEEEKPTETEEEPEKPTDQTSTFTKQFPNLKGETPEEYLPELEKAYDNSFKEALRLNTLLKEKDATIATLQQNPSPAEPENPTNPALTAIDEHPAIQYAKAKQTEDMLSAFDDFKKSYPQATDQTAFEQFTKASDGINQALTSALGRQPTYAELFPAIAGSLGWQPTTNNSKGATIKENASSGRSPGSQSPAPTRPSRVSKDQIDAYLKMFTSKTREEAIKELSEVV